MNLIMTDKNLLLLLLAEHDVDENGRLGLEEFINVMRDLLSRVSLFNGLETVAEMNVAQLKVRAGGRAEIQCCGRSRAGHLPTPLRVGRVLGAQG